MFKVCVYGDDMTKLNEYDYLALYPELATPNEIKEAFGEDAHHPRSISRVYKKYNLKSVNEEERSLLKDARLESASLGEKERDLLSEFQRQREERLRPKIDRLRKLIEARRTAMENGCF